MRAGIEDFPNELLGEIFHAYDAVMESVHHVRPKKERCHRSHWLPLMLVCRHWRAVGVSTPSLWQLIEVGDNQDGVELALARSGALPVRLLITDNSNPASLSSLIPHADRLQKIIYPQALSVTLLQQLESLFDIPMPVLDELEILSTYMARLPPLKRGLASVPNLRTLRLSFLQLPFDTIELCKLHYLSVGGWVFIRDEPEPHFTHKEILGVLQKCVALKELRLRGVFSQPIRAYPIPIISLNLPRLRKLVVWDSPSFTSRFLSGVHLPPDVTLRACCTLPASFSTGHTSGGFAALLPPDLSGLPILRSVTTASIDCWQDRVTLKGTFGDAKISLKVVASAPWDLSSYLHNALQQFRSLFAGAPIKKLHLRGDLDSVPSVDDYLSFLEGFPTLQTIEVRGHRSPLAFLLALAPSSPVLPSDASSERTDAGAGEQSSERIVCAELQSLLMNVDWQSGIIEALVTGLRRRISRGLPKLEDLMLTLCMAKAGSPQGAKEQLEDALGLYEEELKSLTCKFECRSVDQL